MKISNKDFRKASPQRTAVARHSRGMSAKIIAPDGGGTATKAVVKKMVGSSPKTDVKKGDKGISKEFKKSILKIVKIGLMLLIFFFTFFALVMKAVVVALSTIVNAVSNFIGKNLTKKPYRKKSLSNSFLNFLGSLDQGMFWFSYSLRQSMLMPVMVRNYHRFGGYSITARYHIMMTLPNPDANVEAYMVIPHNHGKAVTKMNDIIAANTDNVYVPILIADLDIASGLVEDYNKAHGAARKVTLALAVAAIEIFMAKFQTFADLPANKANSIVIIQSGGYHVKGIGGGHPSTWDALPGHITGEIMMTFITGVGTCCYDPWYSLDGIIWVRMDPTIYNHATITGMVPDSYIFVRYQLCDAHGPEGFHPVIRVRVPL